MTGPQEAGSVWHFTLIVDGERAWTAEELRALRAAGLTDVSFGDVGGDCYALAHRASSKFGRAVGEVTDRIEQVTGRRVIGMQREPGGR